MPKAPFHDLRSYLAALTEAKELTRVRCEVDPQYEITQIVQETIAKDGSALLFERVKGSPYPLAINLLGKMSRIELAFGRHPESFGREFLRLGEKLMPPTLAAVLGERQALMRFRFMHPKRVSLAGRRGGGADFTSLPVLTCWPKDAGRFITYGLVVSANPRSRKQNLGVYRMQVLDGRRVIMHWQIQKGGSTHAAEQSLDRMPVAIAIGADPATMFAAVCPLPEDVDELHFAGLLLGGSTRLAWGAEVPLEVPAEAEFLIEGWVDLANQAPEGPFGDHFGHYSHAAPFPVFETASLSMKRDPIYVASVVGKPPQEDHAIGDAIQMIFTPILRLIHPELIDAWAYYEAGFHNLMVASVKQRYAKEGIKTALGMLGQGQLSLTKCLILVDPDVNPRSFPEVLRAIGANFDPAEDLLLFHRTALDTLDFTSMEMNLGSKMIIDATSLSSSTLIPQPPLPHTGEGRGGRLRAESSRPGRYVTTGRRSKKISLIPHVPGVADFRIWEDALLAVKVSQQRGTAVKIGGGTKTGGGLPKHPTPDTGAGRAALERLLARVQFKIVAAVSEDVDLNDDVSLLWGIFTRFDCARDLMFAKSEIRGAWPKLTGPMGIDATFKKGYPDPVTMHPEIVALVEKRWPEYQLPF